MKRRFTEEQIISILKQHGSAHSKKHGILSRHGESVTILSDRIPASAIYRPLYGLSSIKTLWFLLVYRRGELNSESR